MEKIVVVGGSVSGGFSAYNLSKNFDVDIIEEHSHFKKTCSGIVTDPVNNIIKVKSSIIENKISKIRVYSPNNKYLEFNLKKPDTIFNREKLNEYIVNLALDNGANLKQNTRFERTEKNSVVIKSNNKTSTIKTNYLIGADGSLSQVAKSVGLFGKREFFIAAKAIVEMKNDNAIEVFPYIGCFSWIVPQNEHVVELGTMSHFKDSQAFNNFLKRFNGKIISKEASIIPIFKPKIKTFTKFNNINTYLIGDAATMAKATTGGSILQSLIAAKILGNSIIKNKDYDSEWKKKIGKQLSLHLKMRKVLDKLNLEDWNKLVETLDDQKIKNLFETKSRDFPSFIFKALLLKPSLFSLTKVLFRTSKTLNNPIPD